MEVWPGFISSILNYHAGPMLQLEVSHKLLSMRTVRDVIRDVMQNSRNPNTVRADINRRVVGMIVLTKYAQESCFSRGR